MEKMNEFWITCAQGSNLHKNAAKSLEEARANAEKGAIMEDNLWFVLSVVAICGVEKKVVWSDWSKPEEKNNPFTEENWHPWPKTRPEENGVICVIRENNGFEALAIYCEHMNRFRVAGTLNGWCASQVIFWRSANPAEVVDVMHRDERPA